jgi:hypothetical protein
VTSAPIRTTAASMDSPRVLPIWMRNALLATAVMNLTAGLAFLPPAQSLRALAGMPDGEPVYLTTVALFVMLFGAGYAWVGLTRRDERLFLTLSAIGKIAFVGIVACYWLAERLPFQAVVTASGDLVFGAMFAGWLLATRRSAW